MSIPNHIADVLRDAAHQIDRLEKSPGYAGAASMVRLAAQLIRDTARENAVLASKRMAEIRLFNERADSYRPESKLAANRLKFAADIIDAQRAAKAKNSFHFVTDEDHAKADSLKYKYPKAKE